MGYSSWSTHAFDARSRYRRDTGTTAFTYDRSVRESGRRECHPEMNVLNRIRESRDSEAHPQSVSIGVVFDVTGSMGGVPRVLQGKLGALMRTLISNGYLAHPQVLFGAVGDAYCDAVPLQIGQFESGLEMDDDLGKIFIEGGGGGNPGETYELAMYYFARRTIIDCYEKRSKKGYLFTIGDEPFFDVVKGKHIQTYINSEAAADDVSTETIVAELAEKYWHFHIVPTSTRSGKRPDVHEKWRNLLGQRALFLDDPNSVVETIALAIGLVEGTLDDLDDAAAALTRDGYDAGAVASASRALVPFNQSRALTPRMATGMLPVATAGDDGRL